MRNNQGGYQEREGKRDENRNSQSTEPPSLFIYLTYLFIYLFIYHYFPMVTVVLI